MIDIVKIDHVTVKILDDPERNHQHRLEFSSSVLLLDVLLTGAELAHEKLLPPGQKPLDQLCSINDGKTGPVISNLEEALEKYLQSGGSTHFGIQLLRIFAVNNRWAVATKPEMTPRDMLMLVGLNFEDYTLYPPESDKMLPLDTPVKIRRGEKFEAQRDGRYGEAY